MSNFRLKTYNLTIKSELSIESFELSFSSFCSRRLTINNQLQTFDCFLHQQPTLSNHSHKLLILKPILEFFNENQSFELKMEPLKIQNKY